MTIDRKRLRELALAATPGDRKRRLVDNDWYVEGPGSFSYLSVAVGKRRMPLAFVVAPLGDVSRLEADIAFIAEANPQTILAILDALDAAEQPAPDDGRPSTPPTDGAV